MLIGLKGKLILAMLAIGTIPMVFGLSTTYFKGKNQLREIIGESFSALALNSASKLDAEIMRLLQVNEVLAKQAGYETTVTATLSGLTDGSKFDWPDVRYSKTSPTYLVHSWISKQASVNVSGITTSTVKLFNTDGQKDRFILRITTPILEKNSIIPMAWLHRQYAANKMLNALIYPIRFGDTGHVMLIDNVGVVVSCPLLPTGTSIADTGLTPRIAQNDVGWIRAKIDGHGGNKDSLIGHAPLKKVNRYLQASGKSLYTFAWQDSGEIFAPIYSLQQGVLIAGFIALVLLGMLGVYASSRVLRPIRRLSEESRFIARGDLSRSIDIHTGDEIEELANQFNHMTSQLRHLIDNLEEKVEERTRDLVTAQAEKDQVVKQLIQTEKVATIGVMASGIGHEINNPLYAILGRAEAIADGETREKNRQYGQEIVGYCNHISSIIKDLAGFVRPHNEDTLELVDINKKIAEAIAMVKMPLLNDHVKIIEQCQDVPGIRAQPQEIQQILFNIIRNGLQAIKDRGTVTVESCQSNNHVRVVIKDDGPGIKSADLDKIFDPFFTTKGPDEGEGLGLHIVRKSVKKNGGTLFVESQAGKGAVFTLEFPVGNS